MMRPMISRRHFLGTVGTAAAGLGTAKLIGAEPAKDKLRLGMMLQAGSTADTIQRAKTIAAAGFDTVQVTFQFPPTAGELQQIAATLKDLKLKTAAFGTYFNLFKPDDTAFMRSSLATMKLVAAHASLFDCTQFVSWSASYSGQFRGEDARNHTPEAVAQLRRAIHEMILPVLEPIGGRLAFEPFFLHVTGTLELTKAVLAPFPANRLGLVLDPPNMLTPALYPKREEEMRRLFRELGDRIHLAHFKDMKLAPDGKRVDYPGPGGGEMNYPLLISEIRKLNRSLPCIIEHIKAEPDELAKTKAWVETQIKTGH